MVRDASVLVLSSVEPESLLIDMLPWLGAFVVVVLVGGALALWLRRRYNQGDDGSSDTFSLHQLRRLHASGELSLEEFTQAKSTIVTNIRSLSEPKQDVEP